MSGLRALAIAWIVPAVTMIGYVLGSGDDARTGGSVAFRVVALVALFAWLPFAVNALRVESGRQLMLATALIGFGAALTVDPNSLIALAAYFVIGVAGTIGFAWDVFRGQQADASA